MKEKTEDIAKGEIADLKKKKLTRKEAIKKSGYIAISVATTMILLGSPNKAQATSPAAPGNPGDTWLP